MDLKESRRLASARFTRLLKENQPFSGLRLGDGELAYLLEGQRGRRFAIPDLKSSVETAYDGPGIDLKHYTRLRASYEGCTYLDFHDNIPFNVENLPKLELDRLPGSYRNESPDHGNLMFDWTYHELRSALEGRRCLIAGAEAALLRELFNDADYREAIRPFWPENTTVHFHQVRGDGRDLSANLDLIKQDLAAIIKEESIDLLLLALGGAAKIICYELASELNIRAVDWGSALRGVAYCGSSGFAGWRSSHNPFFVHVPFSVHMAALQRAFPTMPPTLILAKAHAQLCLELQRKELMRSFSADAIDNASYDPSPENLQRFHEAYRHYVRHYRPLARHNAEAKELVREFDYWLLKKGLGWKGQVFQALVRTKQTLRRALGRGK